MRSAPLLKHVDPPQLERTDLPDGVIHEYRLVA